MNQDAIITIYVVVDDTLKALGNTSDVRATMSDAEVLTVGIVAAGLFHNHHERALCTLQAMGCVGRLSVSRFNRRLHQLSTWLDLLLDTLLALGRTGEAYIIDSLPLPVCRRVRAGRCRKVQGVAYCGYCAAKKEKFYGYRLHLVCDLAGRPVSFELWPASVSDRTPVMTLLRGLPPLARVAADKGYVSDPLRCQVQAAYHVDLMALRRANMTPNTPAELAFIRCHRRRIETLNSQLEKMGIQCLHARTVDGFRIKVAASLLAALTPFFD